MARRDERVLYEVRLLHDDEVTAGGAAVVTVNGVTIVAVFPGLDDAITAELAEYAPGRAFAVATIVLTIVALLTNSDD